MVLSSLHLRNSAILDGRYFPNFSLTRQKKRPATIGMLHQLSFHLIEYSGPCTDYGEEKFPTKMYNPQKQEQLEQPAAAE